MSALLELGRALHQRREEIGLTQAALARLSGLSRTTVNKLEGGSVNDLSVNRAERILSTVGLSLQVPSATSRKEGPSRTPAVELAARTASVSYKQTIQPTTLAASILAGSAPPAWVPHLRTLLDEAPVSLLARVVDELHESSHVAKRAIWARMRSIAREIECRKELWA